LTGSFRLPPLRRQKGEKGTTLPDQAGALPSGRSRPGGSGHRRRPRRLPGSPGPFSGSLFRSAFGRKLIPLPTHEGSKRMARRKVKNHNHWFVSVATPKQGRTKGFDRRTETFPTETDAKQFAKEMLSEKHRMKKHHIVAGKLLGAYLPVRRNISGSQLYSWVRENDPRISG